VAPVEVGARVAPDTARQARPEAVPLVLHLESLRGVAWRCCGWLRARPEACSPRRTLREAGCAIGRGVEPERRPGRVRQHGNTSRTGRRCRGTGPAGSMGRGSQHHSSLEVQEALPEEQRQPPCDRCTLRCRCE
jgi:hypothetical protein